MTAQRDTFLPAFLTTRADPREDEALPKTAYSSPLVLRCVRGSDPLWRASVAWGGSIPKALPL